MAADEPKVTGGVDPEEVRLESLGPNPGAKHRRKRVGRGPGSGKGKTCGRGMKGAGARSGPGPRPGYRGGTIPIHMQKGKLRGPNHKTAIRPIQPPTACTTMLPAKSWNSAPVRALIASWKPNLLAHTAPSNKG